MFWGVLHYVLKSVLDHLGFIRRFPGPQGWMLFGNNWKTGLLQSRWVIWKTIKHCWDWRVRLMITTRPYYALGNVFIQKMTSHVSEGHFLCCPYSMKTFAPIAIRLN